MKTHKCNCPKGTCRVRGGGSPGGFKAGRKGYTMDQTLAAVVQHRRPYGTRTEGSWAVCKLEGETSCTSVDAT